MVRNYKMSHYREKGLFSLDILVMINILHEMITVLHEKILNAIYLC